MKALRETEVVERVRQRRASVWRLVMQNEPQRIEQFQVLADIAPAVAMRILKKWNKNEQLFKSAELSEYIERKREYPLFFDSNYLHEFVPTLDDLGEREI